MADFQWEVIASQATHLLNQPQDMAFHGVCLQETAAVCLLAQLRRSA